MSKDSNEELGVITLYLDDDKELTCEIVAVYEAGGQDYIVSLPEDNDEYGEGEVLLYRYSEDEYEQPVLGYIETDEEQEIAADGFDEWLDKNEFDEIVGEDEI
ncbi:MAG: DUF1292 domain-containing protein [Lachnospiraceae bacterium]|nr:DUF1292 domain-containing protein [Lachnospiraceae bacterium]